MGVPTMEQNCTVILSFPESSPAASSDAIITDLRSNKVPVKIAAMKKAIQLLLLGENPPALLMQVIQFCAPNPDHQLKKLLMLYWEIVPKYDASKKLLPEMILVCNALRNDLNHPNEFIRGCMLRFLCKLREPELLEPLVASIKSNLEHRHSFVRRNAVMAVFHIYKNFQEVLIPDAPELIANFIAAETDIGARRNAFLMLFNCSQDAAMNFLLSHLDQVPKFGDGFSLVILELVRKVCRNDPQQKARFVRCIFALLNSGSAAVSYEAAWTLVSMSSAPTAARAAASTYTALLHTESDNNVKLIVLDRLIELKKHHGKVLQEIMMDLLRSLSSPNTDIRKKVLDLAMELISPRNVEEVMSLLRRELMKTQEKEMDKNLEYRQLLVKSIHSCAVKYPESSHAVVNVLMEFLSGEGALDVVLFVRSICEAYPSVRQSVLGKVLDGLSEISNSRVCRGALWVIGQYCEGQLIDEAMSIIKECVGPLPLGSANSEAETDKDPAASSSTVNGGSSTVKSIVLADGTYATETVYDHPQVEVAADEPWLRKLLAGGDFFLASALANCLTKLCLRARDARGEQDEAVNRMEAESMLIIASIVSYGRSNMVKTQIDQHSTARMCLCLKVLADSETHDALGTVWMKDCQEAFSSLLADEKAAEQRQLEMNAPVTQADDRINIRQLRGTKTLHTLDIDIDDGTDLSRAAMGTSSGGDSEVHESQRVYQLTGLADPVYAEASLLVHDFDIVMDINVINRTPQTLTNLTVELYTMGDLKLVERPQNYNIGPLDQKRIRANIKVSSTETGHIFGTISYDTSTSSEKAFVNLNDIHLDIMDYIQPATCTDQQFRTMWAEFEWENKVAVNTSITDIVRFLNHMVEKTKMNCLTPFSDVDGQTDFLAANLYAKSVFGEDALVNLSVEKREDGKITGYIRIRAKTQGIALSLGDRITAVQRGEDNKNKERK